MVKQTQMLVTDHPRSSEGRFVVMQGDSLQLPSELGTVTAAPHMLPLPSGAYVHNGGNGLDVARVWLTPADFAALCSCLGNHATAITLSHSGSVVTAFSFAPVLAPLDAMSHAVEALRRRMDSLEPELLRADIAAIREGVEELLRRLPELRHSDFVRHPDTDGDDEPVPLVSPSSKRAV